MAFKWLFYAAVILVAGYWLWRRRSEVTAALGGLLAGLREFWQGLFSRKQRPADFAAAVEVVPSKPLPRPFRDFPDPFATAVADRYSPDELVRYSFEALEAWARESGWPRQADNTPHEFARLLSKHSKSLSREARSLAELYCRVAYAPGTLPPQSLDDLRQLWRRLRPQASVE